MSVFIEEIEVQTADDFLSHLDIKNEQWWKDNQQRWVFRGLSTTAHTLLPFAWRPTTINPLARLFEHVPGGEAKTENWEKVEVAAVRQFRNRASALGLITPEPEIRNAGPGFTLNDPTPSKRDHFLAQHHGVPTQYLDWSFSSSVAAHFAVKSALENSSTELCVWAFDLSFQSGTILADSYLQSHGVSNTLIPVEFKNHYDLPARNEYLRHQRGMFVSLGGAKKFHEFEGRWPSMEDYCDPNYVLRQGSDPVLKKFVLKSANYRRLAQLLAREGITRAGLMPTLDNVAKDLLDEIQ